MRKVKLTKIWSWEDEEYPVGTLLEVDDTTAKMLVADGFGTLDDDAPSVKQVGAPSTATAPSEGATDAVTIKLADYNKLMADLAAAKTAQTEPTDKGNTRVTIGKVHNRMEDDPCRGYRAEKDGGFGDYLIDVINASASGGRVSERLQSCKQSTKTVGSDEYASVEESIGGWWIPPAHLPELLEKGIEIDWVRGNGARPIPVPGQMVTINAVTDTTRTSSLYGGVVVYRLKERGQMTAAKGEFEQIELKPKALTGMTYITDAMMHYAPTLAAYVGGQFRDAMLYKELEEFMSGTGAGENLGILNADCTYEQAKQTGQVAATIVTENILKMRSRMRDPEYMKSIWMASLSCMEQLNTLTIDVGTGGAPLALVRIGEDGISRLLGRPLIYTEFCQAIGTVGDIALGCWPAYLIGEGTYATSDSSIHVRFDYNETAFRFVKQLDGQPWWRTTLTLKNSWEVAPFVTLAARA